MPPECLRFIEENRRINPSYEVKIWTERNLRLDAPFVQRAYENKMWAFVSDYLRFQILYEEGGIYLDTDMQVLKPLDPLLDDAGFSGLNRNNDCIYCGIMGAQRKLPLMKAIVEEYDALSEQDFPTSPRMYTRVFKRTQPQGVRIYPASYFYPVDEGEIPSEPALKEAYATHHWAESWRSFVPLRRILRRIGVIALLHRFKRPEESLKHFSDT